MLFRSSSALFLGLDSFLQQLPVMLFTLVGGVLADRRDRRRTLLGSQYVQMGTAIALALLVYFDVVTIAHILLLSFITGLAQAFGGPAYQSLLPQLVGPKELTNAVALNSIQVNIARVLGPLIFAATLSAVSIFGISSVAFPGAAEGVKQAGKTGQVLVTGLSTPNPMKAYVKEGVVKTVRQQILVRAIITESIGSTNADKAGEIGAANGHCLHLHRQRVQVRSERYAQRLGKRPQTAKIDIDIVDLEIGRAHV